MLGFTRLSAAAYGVVARVIDEDGTFRARVAEAADEGVVGRAGWLWLHRPVGWIDDPAMTADAPPPERADGAAPSRRDEKAAARLRKVAADADAARRKATEQLAELRRSEAEARAERDELAATVDALRDERNAAVRRSKEIEAQLAAARRDLRVARQATTDAEVELGRLRGEGPVVLPPAPVPPAPAAPSIVSSVDRFDREGVAASVTAAASAAADLAAALTGAAEALAVDPSVVPAPAPAAAPRPAASKGHEKRGKKHGKGSGRAQPSLPPGVFDGTVDAHRHLIGDAANLLVIDGYNVARAMWSDLAPEEERRRTVALLDDVQARSGGRVLVVFDGDDAVTAPKASKTVRVRFSATGETADDAIVDLLSATPVATPVVVVSSDRAVAADARRQGAVAMGSREFLAAAGR